MTDVLGAIAVAVMIIPASMLVGSILYVVIRDTLRRNIRRE